eukprot:scaffold72818_cov57-Phaeocystis_antarctica.AAC.5
MFPYLVPHKSYYTVLYYISTTHGFQGVYSTGYRGSGRYSHFALSYRKVCLLGRPSSEPSSSLRMAAQIKRSHGDDLLAPDTKAAHSFAIACTNI